MRFILGAALALACTASPALGQSSCAPWQTASQELARDFGERPVAMGQAGHDILAVLANPQTGTFTVVAIRPDGVACLVASGLHWRQLPAGKPA